MVHQPSSLLVDEAVVLPTVNDFAVLKEETPPEPEPTEHMTHEPACKVRATAECIRSANVASLGQ
jgi:hypothetical protein